MKIHHRKWESSFSITWIISINNSPRHHTEVWKLSTSAFKVFSFSFLLAVSGFTSWPGKSARQSPSSNEAHSRWISSPVWCIHILKYAKRMHRLHKQAAACHFPWSHWGHCCSWHPWSFYASSLRCVSACPPLSSMHFAACGDRLPRRPDEKREWLMLIKFKTYFLNFFKARIHAAMNYGVGTSGTLESNQQPFFDHMKI